MNVHSEKESVCESVFLSRGPYWHMYTSGKDAPVLFSSDEDYRFAMNLVCQAALAHPGLSILAFEVMSNHFHFLVCGEEAEARLFFSFIRKRLSRYLTANGSNCLPSSFDVSLKLVQDLRSLRNTIVYINRNGYVVDPCHTPFTYPWGTGMHYFNIHPQFIPSESVFSDERRRMFKGRAPVLPDGYMIVNGHISPSSYCDIGTGMRMFRDAHHYFSMVGKSVESYSELATELDDGEFLTDTELFSQVSRIIRAKYFVGSLRELSKAQKVEMARILHRDYRSSNDQLRRVLNMSQYEVDSLFPR